MTFSSAEESVHQRSRIQPGDLTFESALRLLGGVSPDATQRMSSRMVETETRNPAGDLSSAPVLCLVQQQRARKVAETLDDELHALARE